MTNEQMIRELRAAAEKYKGRHVFTCETNINLMATDAANRIESLCDEISRQKAEIKELEAEIDKQYEQAKADILGNMADGGTSCHWCIDQHRANAVKEFSEMLKATAIGRVAWEDDDEAIEGFVAVDEIDNLVKEFTEETT